MQELPVGSRVVLARRNTMEPIAALLFTLTCTPDLLVCREPQEPTHGYASMDACLAEKISIEKHAARDQRTIARCTEFSPTADPADATVAWYVGPAGKLELELRYETVQTAFAN
jgi:hypothetical protein